MKREISRALVFWNGESYRGIEGWEEERISIGVN